MSKMADRHLEITELIKKIMIIAIATIVIITIWFELSIHSFKEREKENHTNYLEEKVEE